MAATPAILETDRRIIRRQRQLGIDEQAFLPCDRHVHAHLIPPCKKLW